MAFIVRKHSTHLFQFPKPSVSRMLPYSSVNMKKKGQTDPVLYKAKQSNPGGDFDCI